MGERTEYTFFQRGSVDTQHCYSPGKCKSKPQWDITSHLSEWLSSKRPQITHIGKDEGKREPLYTDGGNVNWHSHCGKILFRFLKNLKIELPYGPEILLLGIYLKAKTLFQKDTCTQYSLQRYSQ